MSANMTEIDGWEETACIECKTGVTDKYQTITYDDFKVTQTLDCKNSLINKTPKPNIQKLEDQDYVENDEEGKILIENGYKDIFKTKDDKLCGFVTTCKLKNQLCLEDY